MVRIQLWIVLLTGTACNHKILTRDGGGGREGGEDKGDDMKGWK